MTKAIALLSGGLDSTLAVKLMIEQGIEVHALNFTSAFCTCTSNGAKEGGCKSEAGRVAVEFGIPIKTLVKGLDYMEIVRRPRHGYGKGINPCVDCRIYMFRAAKKYMEEIGASFIITGEVLGQRPMSQRKDAFRVIERESGLEGLILRPLCAQHLEPTKPEIEGLVDRSRLPAIEGRSRKEQMALADDLGVNDYPCPSGGCLLTDKIFSKKVKDLLDNKPEFTLTKKDLSILRAGRHFRFNGVKVIVGRDASDNERLKSLIQSGQTLVEPDDFPGPVAIVASTQGNGALQFAAGLILKYSSGKGIAKGMIRATVDGGETFSFEVNTPISDESAEGARVC
ncbi:MAG: hypothetical protein HY886_03120 [Deltaproteobacteria bacterium]|nr:hypothetical protein [Deltaproteobacteria bacterium]